MTKIFDRITIIALFAALFSPVLGGANNIANQQQDYLKPSNNGISDYYYFGYSVAISGDTLVIGAYREASNATGVDGDTQNSSMPSAGAAYVFVRTDANGWQQQAYLKASNPEASDQFGYAVAISGDTIVVGSRFEDSDSIIINGDETNNLNQGSGAAYVFTRSAGIWSQQAYLKAANSKRFDNFGFSVATSGNTVVVGAPSEDSNSIGVNNDDVNVDASNSGAVYVFTRTGISWQQQAYIKASNTDENDNFGTAIAIDTDTIVVGASSEDGTDTGVNGDQTGNTAYNSGAVYVFTRAANTWAQQAYLKTSNSATGDNFGGSVAISGDNIIIGSHFQSDGASASGAAYAFNRSSNTWSQQAFLKASNLGDSDFFGSSVAISGNKAIVGAYLEDGITSNSGAAYLFNYSNNIWSEQSYLKANNNGASDYFGRAVAISGNNILIGAYQEASDAIGVNGDGTNNLGSGSGAAYVINPFAAGYIFANGFE